MNILLLDDDELTLEIFRSALMLNGFSCTPYKDSSQALDEYEQDKYDLIICDYFMPFLNGIEFAQSIFNKNPEAKIIMYSAHSDKRLVQKAIDSGVYDFLDKPINWAKIMDTLNHLKNKN